MKNRASFRCGISFVLLFLFTTVLNAANTTIISHLKFKRITTLNGLPTDEVQKIYQDKEGFIWLATRYGLAKYDGYRVTVYKSNLDTPGLLTNNNIYCLADDYEGNLWIGTQEGLNRLNKKTGEMYQYSSPAIPNNTVSCLLVTKDNTVWVGSDSGLCRYVPSQDSFIVYDNMQDCGMLAQAPIKSLFEDSEGELWIGT